MTEKVLSWYDRCLGLRSVSLRYFNAAGAWPDGSIGEDWTVTINLVPLLMKAALGKRGPAEIFGTDYPTPDGTAIRDYVHVVDLADAHLEALQYLERGGDTTVLNLGTGVGSSVFEVLAAAEKATGYPVPHELVARRPGIRWRFTRTRRARRRSWAGRLDTASMRFWLRRGRGTRTIWTATSTDACRGQDGLVPIMEVIGAIPSLSFREP